MNRSKRLLLTPLALVAVVAWEAAGAAQPGQAEQPWGTAKSAQSAVKKQDGGHWSEHFQGSGNVNDTRCQGMSRGTNCITAASRKDAARRAAAARDAEADATAPSTGNTGSGGNWQ